MDAFGVERVAEEDLAGVGPLRRLGDEELVVRLGLEASLSSDGQDILLNGELDRRRLTPGRSNSTMNRSPRR
jgi:hypothetical protein